MSFTQPRMKSFKAGADLSAKQYSFVKFGADSETIVSCSVADEKSIGILMNAPLSGEIAEIALPGGGAKLKASATITRGDYLSSTNAGAGKLAAPGSGVHSHIGAIAHDSAVVNDIFEVDVVAFDLIG